ncbi:hypothetical protein FDG56_gp023 [Mycobacterium phage Bask21]|uniref:DUF7257 domain-containing protein n=1 Tax=Mycobacterium phage Bask21 TaxID=2902889 RepID=G1D0M3_9CAUD|nr:hypothetical protein FDG56_gp023 [Mycobacterium phage Bask21]AEK08322.1 hypothetical protein PBI_BASK21_23 [Mycobacterium phage Bask21]
MGAELAKEYIDAWISYVSPAGQVFYLAGPQAPVAGAQNGFVLQEIRGVQAPITHLTSKGARQDGDTWNDSIYESAELDFTVEASGVTTQDTRREVRSWVDAWSPKKLGKFSWFTPENGEWWMDVRQHKNVPDVLSHVRSKRQVFTWTAVNNDAFWKSFDSVSAFGITYEDETDEFDRVDHTGLGDGYIQTYTGDEDAGVCGTDGTVMRWYPGSSKGTRYVHNLFIADKPTSDNVIVSFTYSGIQRFPFPAPAVNELWARCGVVDDGEGGQAWDGSGIRMQLVGQNVSISVFKDHEMIHTWIRPLLIAPLWGEKWTLVCGSAKNGRQYRVLRGDPGFEVLSYTEPKTESYMDEDHRYTGHGMKATAGLLNTQVLPAEIHRFSFADNLQAGQSGHLALSNRGDQDGWPRYLCYGPGTFKFSNGPGTEPTITFGPLLEGQVVMLTTLPRLRSVIDLSPNQPTEQQLSAFQDLIKDLISFATNNNVPPLLQQFESWFGILPPQGNLYELLDGRFTVPIPPKPEDGPPETSFISVSISGATIDSKVVAALTPLRKWPE